MANGDTDTTDTTQQAPTTAPTQPTQQQEQDVNQQIFGGQKPDQAETAKRAMPVDPETKQKDYYEQKRQEWFQKDQDQAQKHEQLLNEYYQKILSIKNEAHPQMPQLEKELPQPGSAQDPNRTRQNIGQIFGQVGALATIAATVFGRRHGQWGRAIQQEGIGQFLKSYTAAQHQQAQQQLENWQKANEVIKQHNRDLVQDYKDILADRHLSLSEQHMLISDLSQIRQDYELYQKAAAKDLSGILSNFAAKDKADIVTSKASLSILNTVSKEYFTNSKVRSWVDSVRERTGKDPLSSPEALRDAEKKYPMSDWVKDSKPFDKDSGINQTESGMPIVKGNDDYNKLKPGTKFVDDQGNQWVKPDGGQ